jgi:hypothetical protein
VQAGVSTATAAPPAPPAQPAPATDKVAYSKTKVPRNRNQLLNHHPPTSQLTTTAHKPTNLADRTATPANTSTTSPQRQSAQWLNRHVTQAQNQRRHQRPLPAMEHQGDPASSFRPKLQLSHHCGLRPPKCPTSHDYAAMLKTASPLRPKLQPPHQCPIRLPKRPTGYDNPTTPKTASTAPQSLAFQHAPRPAK